MFLKVVLESDFLFHEANARQVRRRIPGRPRKKDRINKSRCLYDMPQVHINRVWDLFRIGPHYQEFPRSQQKRFPKPPIDGDTKRAFEHQNLDVPAARIFEKNGCPRDGRRHRSRMDSGSAQPFRHLQEHGSLIQGEISRPGHETKKGFGSQACERIVLKVELGTGSHASFHSDTVLDDFVENGGVGTTGRIDDFHIIDKPAQRGLVKRTGRR